MRYKWQGIRYKGQDVLDGKKILFMSKELEDRFQNFAKVVRDYCLKPKRDIINQEYIKHMIRSNGSDSANYTEASNDLGKADEKMKLKISRREAKETIKWLDLSLTYGDTFLEQLKMQPIDEGEQIRKILSSIIIKLGSKVTSFLCLVP